MQHRASQLEALFSYLITNPAGNSSTATFDLVSDKVGPTVALNVPATSGLGVAISWEGLDIGAGVRDYTVAYKQGTGNWIPWLTAVSYTQGTFIGTGGYSYTFRVQASDNVNNESTWVESAPVSVEAVTKYYAFGGQRIAMRQGSEVYYLGGDHLGSTSLTTDGTGVVVSEVRYLPYGQVRWSNGTSVTDFGFTSQREEAGFGLVDYNARYYSAVLGQFVSPDTIIPDPMSSGGLNRYRYVKNNPLNYVDPSGHCVAGENNECDVELTDEMLHLRTVEDYEWYLNNNISDAEILTFVATGLVVPKVLAHPVAMLNGMIAEAGYTGSVIIENCLGDGCSFEGWNNGDGIASFVTGGITGLPGRASSFVRGAAQNGLAYVGGQLLNGEMPDLTTTALNTVTGGLGGRVSDGLAGQFLGNFKSNFGAAAAKLVSPIATSSVGVGVQNAVKKQVEQTVQAIESIIPYAKDPIKSYVRFLNPHIP